MSADIGYPQFLEYVTFAVKLALHTNKGGTEEEYLEKCIVIYNEFKKIEENMDNLPKQKFDRVSKLLLRFNLSFKVKPDGTLANPSLREECRAIYSITPHPIMYSEDMEAVNTFINENDINPITGIPLKFLLKEGRFQEISWLYIKSIFFISQYILAKNPRYLDGPNVLEDALNNIDENLTRAEILKEDTKIEERLARDGYLRRKLYKPEAVNVEKIAAAKEEMFKIFRKKGTENNLIFKLIDRVGERVSDIQQAEGSLFEGMLDAAKDIASDMSEDLLANRDTMQSSVSAVKDVFKDALRKNIKNGDNISPELLNIADTVTNLDPENPNIDISQLSGVIDATSNIHGFTSESLGEIIQRNRDSGADLSELPGNILNVSGTGTSNK
jgi:hypothetical protein